MIDIAVIAPGCTVSVEPATWRDLNSLRQIEKVCFPLDAWPIWDLIGVLTLPDVVRLKAVCDGKMVGFIAGDLRRTQGMVWIATISVLPEYRGRGIGSALLLACEEKMGLPRIRLCVRKSNLAAIRLYQRLGYEKYEEWARYYQDGEAALVMEKLR
jgi:ribosomal-protein-alanine N-acetyltransferase